MLLTFVLAAIQTLPPAEATTEQMRPGVERAAPVAAKGRAGVRILRAFHLRADQTAPVEGAQRRSAQLTGRDGTATPAYLVEFE